MTSVAPRVGYQLESMLPFNGDIRCIGYRISAHAEIIPGSSIMMDRLSFCRFGNHYIERIYAMLTLWLKVAN